MKTKITALALVAVTALAFVPKPAKAGDKELAAIGGFIGGVILGTAINHHRNDDCPPPGRSTTVIVNRGGPDHCDDGYWRETRVKVWVPARWVYERDRRGCEVKRYVSGYYDYRTERVWVAYDRHDRRNRDHRTVIVTRR